MLSKLQTLNILLYIATYYFKVACSYTQRFSKLQTLACLCVLLKSVFRPLPLNANVPVEVTLGANTLFI